MALRDLFFRKLAVPVPAIIPPGALAWLRITAMTPDDLSAEVA